MTQPLPPDNDFVPEDLPLRHRGFRAREAETIRLEFIRFRKRSTAQQDSSANTQASDEQ